MASNNGYIPDPSNDDDFSKKSLNGKYILPGSDEYLKSLYMFDQSFNT